MDWGLIQVIVALALLPYVIPQYWYQYIASALRWTWLKVNFVDGQCEYLAWTSMAEISTRRVHTCRGHYCQHFQHIAGGKCWRGSVKGFFSGVIQRQKVEKPAGLALRQSFLCVDTKVIAAYILCTIWVFSPSPIHVRPSEFNFGALYIKPELDEESKEVLVHVHHHPTRLSQPAPNTNLTVQEIDLLLKGYPPYYRKTLVCFGMNVPSPIKTDADVQRGGWIIGVGLSDMLPIPVYMDTMRAPSEDRGTVFWRSIARVKAIVENNIRPLFPDERAARNIQATINGLNQGECIQAMEIFNDSPRLDAAGLQLLRTKLPTSLLLPVLHAALRGAEACVVYVKNPGRELDTMIPELLMPLDSDTKKIFLRGCI
ncbi:hypothetical protein B0H34DRAFT_709144 [Crassisporium funariophilum]|nr:hypothetical protein B0H34DRAFT_709144 [Crassisporium funariophilum]